ncbi:MAG: tRNA 2-selenouridine(34) synthase MnmH [Drouetiella hepatica Uher 2000/2452]|uniref:tRNA 2-selenouridine(34) synthase MnmH n=1 Tax=Drouetiella hepatica Uher 2000/2452 TaxID=904376 RepID=A0A951QCG0_9CYAN|nr:tRNA 2-selenouridine(34) synthase MnmH [Drouetiella hepatica Uher 2000/2452]
MIQTSLESFLSAPGIILDVRSPAEYQQGHIPGAVSFPLFTDAERTQVGTCYKQKGRDEAVELGFAIAGPKFSQFIADAKQLSPDRHVRIHCWRGGMRSGAVAWVLETAGFKLITLAGGYKMFRRWAIAIFEPPKPILIVGGMTGTGKTNILAALHHKKAQVLDLEGLASHRGSSYGSLGLPPQPTNEQFENEIAVRWAAFDPNQPVWIEAESNRIGTCRVPESLFLQMNQATVLEIKRSRSERLSTLVQVYGSADRQDLISATMRIQKRLGGQRTKEAIELIQSNQLTEAFDIILGYYDKTYTYDLQRRNVKIYPIEATGLQAADVATTLLADLPQLKL